MKILTTSCEINREITRLLAECSSCQIAVAWATIGFKVFDLLKTHKAKIERMIVGTHFYQTHPDFIESFITHKNVHFIKATDEVFHPKVYYFQMSSNRWECIIGSANLTRGGFERNDEVAILVTDEDRDSSDTQAELFDALDKYWRKTPILDKSDLEAYRQAWKRKRPIVQKLEGKFGLENTDQGDGGKSPLEIPVLSKTWREYFNCIKVENKYFKKEKICLETRLKVIQSARNLFDNHVHFCDMNDINRRKIAGLIDGSDDGVNYLLFGSMRGAGKFQNVINNNDKHLSQALDLIPASGYISKNMYLKYIDEYLKAFPEGRHGIATATRLLTLKRPDIFVCLTKNNQERLCQDFSIKKSVTYEAYWDSIIERIKESTWGNAPCPKSKIELQVWRARAAFLDSIYYVK
ncbi:MAG: phospholipase D-like domain-containing protein [Gemmatimonadetes bacterium]|nr:phospholipase D-like domain-containing protein [Gemmatimonadota bacterium]